MLIASQKRKENIAEYLLYMWQVEDLTRAYGLDIDKIEHGIIDRFNPDEKQRKEMRDWYESLIDMMRREDVQQKGHLQLNKNTILQLDDLHRAILADPRFEDYRAEFYKTLPYIVELRAKAGDEKAGEIETCFNALYGIMMLRMQGKPVTPETEAAVKQIARFVALLAKDFHLNEQDRLFKDD